MLSLVQLHTAHLKVVGVSFVRVEEHVAGQLRFLRALDGWLALLLFLLDLAPSEGFKFKFANGSF